MANENSQNSGLSESDDVRRRALLRLGVAGLVTAAALTGLWWLDQGGGKQPEKPATLVLPAPIVSAPMQESPPPQAANEETAPASEQPASPSSPIAATPIPADQTAANRPGMTPEAPPPPKVSNTLKSPQPPATLPRSAPAQPPAPQTTTAQTAATGERFVVQLGVFSNPEHARELVDKLTRQGIRARMETRVHLGPFASRLEAEKAQAEMRKLGLQALITPASATK